MASVGVKRGDGIHIDAAGNMDVLLFGVCGCAGDRFELPYAHTHTHPRTKLTL